MNEQVFDPQNTEDALYFKDTNCPAEFSCKIFEVSLKKLKRSYVNSPDSSFEWISVSRQPC